MKKVLIVEDEEVLRFLYEEEMKGEGYEVFTAENGEDAVHRVAEVKPDLILLDIAMPVLNGMEALDIILRKEKGIPIIFHTSHPEYQDDFKSWAADAYVLKSFDLSELKATTRRLLEKGVRANE